MLISTGKLTQQSLAGQVVVVTGAGGGIGYEACRALIWLGAKVVVAEIDRKKGVAAAEKLNEEFGAGSALFVQTDVGDERSIAALQKQALKAYGRVDVVINNATIAPLGAVEDVPIDSWDASYRVNLRGPVLLARAFIPEMRARNAGVFVCVSSVGTAYAGPYESMKAAQVHLANTLDAELEGTNVITFAIGPGYVPTETASTALPKLAAMMGLDLAALQETLKEQTISVEAAGAGFAAAVALAGEFRGQETASLASLIAAGFQVQTGVATTLALSDETFAAIFELARKVRTALDEQYQGYKQRSVFEQQWVYRTFKKYAGTSIDEVLKQLSQVEQAAQTRDGQGVQSAGLRAGGVARFHAHMHEMAKGYIKDPAEREKNLAIVRGWKEDAERLAEMLKPS
jgi:NAD(P)-dependent dehydrogenase (short-subunit alcohol dehydrogenase family)